jgi:hypothetical protein
VTLQAKMKAAFRGRSQRMAAGTRNQARFAIVVPELRSAGVVAPVSGVVRVAGWW